MKFHGHAIECRINAENPVSFRPSPGKIVHYHPPGGLGVRIDSAVYHGYTIPPFYDSLVGKLIVHGKTRSECLMRLRRALDEFVVDGIETTLPLFRALAREKDIIDGDYHIHWLEEFLARGARRAIAALRRHAVARRFYRVGEKRSDQCRLVRLAHENRARHAQLRVEHVHASGGIDNRQVRQQLPRPTGERDAVHAAGQIDIGEQNVDGRRGEMPQRVRCVGSPYVTAKPCSDSDSATHSLIRNSSSTSRTRIGSA